MFTELQNRIIYAIVSILTNEKGMRTDEELVKDAKSREEQLEHDVGHVYGGHIYNLECIRELYCVFPKVIDGKIFIGIDEPIYNDDYDPEPEIVDREVIGYIPLSDHSYMSVKISDCIKLIGLLIDQR